MLFHTLAFCCQLTFWKLLQWCKWYGASATGENCNLKCKEDKVTMQILNLSTKTIENKHFIHYLKPDDDRIVSHDAFSRSITQYHSHGRFHHEIRSFSCRLFSHSISSKSKKITLFCYLTWFFQFAMAKEWSFHIETYIFMVSISLPITKCSVTHSKVMNIQDF